MSDDTLSSLPTTPTIPKPNIASMEDLLADHRQLRRLFHCMAISLILLTGTVFVFLYRQVVLVRRQTVQLERYAAQYESLANHKMIEQMRNQLGIFARQNPDFAPIFNKYFAQNGLGQTQAQPAAQATPNPAPNGPSLKK